MQSMSDACWRDLLERVDEPSCPYRELVEGLAQCDKYTFGVDDPILQQLVLVPKRFVRRARRLAGLST